MFYNLSTFYYDPQKIPNGGPKKYATISNPSPGYPLFICLCVEQQ